MYVEQNLTDSKIDKVAILAITLNNKRLQFVYDFLFNMIVLNPQTTQQTAIHTHFTT